MELLQLRYFLDTAETENFSETAANFLVPQPSISKTIKKLETELGVKLFDRVGKKVILNKNGKYFYRYVKQALYNIDHATNHFLKKEKPNITIYTQAGSRFVSLLIADFLTSTADIFVSTANRTVDGKEPDYTFTFMQILEDMNKYNYEPLMKDEIVAVISNTNPLREKKLLSIKDLATKPFVGYYKTINLRDFTDKYCKTYGDFTPNVVFETHDYAALRYMIEKDKGIGLLPEKFFNLQHSDKVTIVPLKEKVSRSLAIAWDKDKLLTEDEQNFLEYTKKWFDSL